MSVYSVSVYPGSVTIRKGEWYYGAYATVRASSNCCTDVTWYSDKTAVATVNATTGYIYGRSAGTARIYAQSKVDSSKWDYITVNVTNGNICVDSVCLNYSYLSLEKGDRRDLSATVCPANATNKSISWSSSNPAVATVSGGTVRAVGVGSATITARAQDGSGEYDTCYVNVTGDILVSSITLNHSSYTLNPNGAVLLRESICPTNATNKCVRWSSSDNGVARVNPDSGYVTAQGAGTAIIRATAQDGSGKYAECRVTVNRPIAVTDIEVCPKSLTMNVGDVEYLCTTIIPYNATNQSVTWCSSNENVATVGIHSGRITAKRAGTATITATVQENAAISDSCIIWCDEFLYRLVNELRFAEDDAKLIRSLYDKVEEKYNTETRLYRAWMSSRLIGGICYGNETSGMNAQFKWNDVAGRVFLGSEEDYFVNTLGFTSAEYKQLVNSIKRQHADTDTPDFVHMQISLAARLAYKLNLDGIISNLGTFCSDETVSYLAGWLGDATITNSNGLTSFGNDDYCADLDAENIYRAIMSNNKRTIIDATNIYYDSLNSQNSRADVFLGYISIDDVKQKIFARFGIAKENNPMNIIKNSYPDTYNFICSLSDSLEHIMNY